MARPADPKKYGTPVKYDPKFKGPIKRRSCTDILCLALLFVFVLVWIGIAVYAYRYGNPSKLVVATNSQGQKCGVDSHVTDKKYLYFFDLTKCANPSVLINGCNTPQVCVESCPTSMWTATQYVRGLKQFDKSDIQSNIICKNDNLKNTITSVEILRERINDNSCAEWHLPSHPLHMRCLPLLDDLEGVEDWIRNAQLPLDVETISNSTEVVYNYATLKEFGTLLIQDFDNTWPYMVASIGVSIVISFLVIILLRWLAGPVTWTFLLLSVVLLAVGAYFSFQRYHDIKTNGPVKTNSRMLKAQLDSVYNDAGFWMFLGIAAVIVGLIVLLIIIFLRKRIVIAIALIKEGSKAVGSVASSLFFPVVPLILQCLVILWGVGIGVFLSSIGNSIYKTYDLDNSCVCTGDYSVLKNGDICDPDEFNKLCHNAQGSGNCSIGKCVFIERDTTYVQVILQIINAFGVFWGVWFMAGLSQMILADSFATWYWTFNKSRVPIFTLLEATGRTLFYHLGTVAFGSLIIAICSFIRATLEYIEKKMKNYENKLIKALFCCLKCFFWCLQKFLQFISRNAYIMCAIHGKNFCASAKDAFNLLMRNTIRVLVLDKVTDFLFFIAKLVVTAIMVGGAYLLLFHNNAVHVNYVWLPLIVIGVTAFVVASVFFSVFAMAVDTLFLCFLEDCERNDGSPEKPYFMSRELMKVLGKRNKRK